MADYNAHNDASFNKRLMPPQKISLKKKTKVWREKCVDYVIRNSSTANPWCNNPHRIYSYQENINAYEGVFSHEDLAYITNPFNVKDELPARLKDYNLVRPLIDSMIGEEVNRPFKFVVTRTSQNATNEFQDKLKEMLTNYCIGAIMSKMPIPEAQQYEQQLQSGQVQPPAEIARWGTESYKDIAEEFCAHLLKYLINKLDIRTAFLRGYKDVLLNREEIYFVGEEYGHANLRWVNPACFAYEYSPDMVYIDEATWCAERLIISYAELHDRYKDEMTEQELQKIMDRIDGIGTDGKWLNSDPNQMGAFHWDWNVFPTTGLQYPFEVMSADCIEIWKVHWKSFRKIYFITLNDPQTNQPYVECVDEDYEFTGDEEEVQEDWVMQVWQGFRVGGDIYFGIRPVTGSFDRDDPASVSLPYTGLAAQGKSVMELLKPMSVTYLSLWYRLELLLARDNGRVLNMDITQIPRTKGLDVTRWAHMMKSMGVNLINPYETGWDVPGRDGTRPAPFNAFSSVDLSMSQSIGMYIDLITKVEQMAQQVIGFNPQRLGQVGHRDLSGTTQEALEQSYNTNALIVYMHDMVKQRALRKLMNVALAIRYEDEETFLNYVGTDGMRVFLEMPQSAMESMDLFVSNSAEEQKKLEELKNLYQPAMQNGATLVDVLYMMESENLTEIRVKLEEIEQRKQQMMQQQQQEQAQQQQAQMAQVEKDRAVNVDQKNADRTLKKYQTDVDAETKLKIAQLTAETKLQAEQQKAQENPLEVEKLELERQKIENDAEMKRQANDLASQKAISDMEMKRREIDARQEELTRQLLQKAEESENKRLAEFRKLDLEKEKIKIQREEMANEFKQMRLEHELEMKKLREEFKEQLRLAKMAEEHALKMARKEAELEMQAKKSDQQHETKIKELDNKGKIKLQREKYEGDEDIIEKEYEEKAKEEKRKAREAEEKARKKAKEAKSSGSSSSGSSSSSSTPAKSSSSSSSSSSKSTSSPSSSSSSSGESGGPSITVTKINL